MSIADTHGHRHDDEDSDTIEFEPDTVREHLDSCIRHWRAERDRAREWPDDGAGMAKAETIIDVYQSMRVSLFGEPLPAEVQPQNDVSITVYRNGVQLTVENYALTSHLVHGTEVRWNDAGAHYVVRTVVKS